MQHPLATVSSLGTATVVCTLAAVLSASPAATARPTAHVARTLSLNESGHLRLTSKEGFTLNEQGTTTGTIRGTIYIHLHLLPNSRVTAEVNIYPSRGSLSGIGSADYSVIGSYASFGGTLAINRGTGGYSHARASRLRFTGTIQRRGDAVTVQVSGPLAV